MNQVGARIAFVDIDPDTCLMDPNRLEDFLKARFASGAPEDRPAAVVPVHLYGQCVDMDAVNELARRHGLRVLEDAAQAHGARYRGRPAGTLGDAAAFSFYPGKNLGACGDAGAVTTSNLAVAEEVRTLRDHGQKQKYVHVREGYNARLDALQAGFLRVKLRHLEGWNQRRREAAAWYDRDLADLERVRPVQVQPWNVPARHLYVVHAAQRDALQTYLKGRGITCGLHYPIPLHLQACYAALGYGPGSLPQAEWSAARVLSLPLYPELEAEQVRRVVAAVRAFAEDRPARAAA
jgi:dTDP-4-amino-4,6-dideoxygalactose transaminase